MTAALLLALMGAHVLQEGETLSSLCKRNYGSEHYAGLLALHNRVEPTQLRLGQELMLPRLERLVRSEGLGVLPKACVARGGLCACSNRTGLSARRSSTRSSPGFAKTFSPSE